uniref:Tyrosine-protein phosphatase domain-containing protein n=1 Tax=Hucho hucho TaxID=62062 RepID=A0A4W5LM04_9TELE
MDYKKLHYRHFGIEVFTEYEQIPKKRADCVVTTATLADNGERNRFRDVVPYEENRVELVPNKENNTGYINASHIKVGSGHRVYTSRLIRVNHIPLL